MAARLAARYVSRRLSSSGKVLSEEEKAAENVYIKKMEKQKLEKLAHKGEQPPADGVPEADVKPSTAAGSSTAEVSTDKKKNYGIFAGAVAIIAAVGWYVKSSSEKPEEVHN